VLPASRGSLCRYWVLPRSGPLNCFVLGYHASRLQQRTLARTTPGLLPPTRSFWGYCPVAITPLQRFQHPSPDLRQYKSNEGNTEIHRMRSDSSCLSAWQAVQVHPLAHFNASHIPTYCTTCPPSRKRLTTRIRRFPTAHPTHQRGGANRVRRVHLDTIPREYVEGIEGHCKVPLGAASGTARSRINTLIYCQFRICFPLPRPLVSVSPFLPWSPPFQLCSLRSTLDYSYCLEDCRCEG